MKALNTRYIVLILLLSLGSATAHALIDHDYHGCKACILSQSNKQSSIDDLNDIDDGNSHFSLPPENLLLYSCLNTKFSSVHFKSLKLSFLKTSSSIRAPPHS